MRTVGIVLFTIGLVSLVAYPVFNLVSQHAAVKAQVQKLENDRMYSADEVLSRMHELAIHRQISVFWPPIGGLLLFLGTVFLCDARRMKRAASNSDKKIEAGG